MEDGEPLEAFIPEQQERGAGEPTGGENVVETAQLPQLKDPGDIQVDPPEPKKEEKVKKVRCENCLCYFNPRYMARHRCLPPRLPVVGHEVFVEEETPLPPPPPPPEAPVRIMTEELCATFLREQKAARRAEKVQRYSSAMFGA